MEADSPPIKSEPHPTVHPQKQGLIPFIEEVADRVSQEMYRQIIKVPLAVFFCLFIFKLNHSLAVLN